MIPRVGVVAIGRNEGERLRVCLESARRDVHALVYVDSGSTDGSVELASTLGAAIVELDPNVPFTAARARNAGLERLLATWPEVELVQFVDGDCEIEAGWIEAAAGRLEAEDWVVVCGRRRERHPEASVYNLLCDMEWDTPVGPAQACGGDAMMRIAAFRAVGGYADDLIAGEEPELCVRLAARGGRILRLDAPMTIHDAQMFAFSQWWTRAKRAGHAVAEAAARHPGFANGASEREVRSAWVWAAVLPATILLLAVPTHGGALVLALAWPLQILRIAWRRPRPNFPFRDNLLYAAACVVGKGPHLAGILRFRLGQWTGRRSRLIEYKGVSS
ncbi:MAG: glycosyltransferase family A protein [Myxococcota bacterium]